MQAKRKPEVKTLTHQGILLVNYEQYKSLVLLHIYICFISHSGSFRRQVTSRMWWYQTEKWSKNVSNVRKCFFIKLTTLKAILMDTLISRQLYLWPPSQNPVFLNSIQTLYFYIPVSSQVVTLRKHPFLLHSSPVAKSKGEMDAFAGHQVVHSW